MRHKILCGLLCCLLLSILALQTPGTKRLTTRDATTLGKGKLPRLDPSDAYLVYYGEWNDQSLVDKVRSNFKLVIVGNKMTKEPVAKLKAKDGKASPLVFCYLSIGEDDTNAEQNGPAYKGDESGPCFNKDTTHSDVVTNCSGKGKSKGVASYYLDQYIQEKKKKRKAGQDGRADRNSEDPTSGSLYANTGDTTWRKTVKDEAKRLIDDVGCDGLFLDTLDMADNDQYLWARKSMRSLIFELNDITPNLLVNRGFFFMDEDAYPAAEIQAYKNHIWGLMFENFYATTEGVIHAIKDMSENEKVSKRLAGVQVFALDYLDCKQSDFATASQSQRDKVKSLGWLNYISWNLTKTVRYNYQCP